MSHEEILAAFERPDIFPEEAFQEALKRPEELKPLLIKALRDLWKQELSTGIESDYNLQFHALHLLVLWRDPAVFDFILQTLQAPDDNHLESFWSDMWINQFPRCLEITFSGEAQLLIDTVNNFDLNVYHRVVAAEALHFLWLAGKLARQPLLDLWTRQLQDPRNYGDYMLEKCHYLLLEIGPEESRELLLKSGCVKKPEFEEHLKLGIEGCRTHYRQKYQVGDLEDLSQSLRFWGKNTPEPDSFTVDNLLEMFAPKANPPPKAKPKTPAFQPPPPPKPKALVNQDERLISRNGPCPCGSGKIYKKCCAKN